MQQLLHDDAYLKQMWQTAIQWLQYEMEKVGYGKKICTEHDCIRLLLASCSH